MNTLAVNRLLRKLEAAIVSGQHEQAAMFAKELARLKIPCSVVRQKSTDDKKPISVNIYIEDKNAHQGPLPLQVQKSGHPSIRCWRQRKKINSHCVIIARGPMMCFRDKNFD